MLKLLICLIYIFFSNILLFAQNAEPLDLELENYPYPFDVRFYEFESQGRKLKMAYMDVIPGKPNGKIVVLFHGKNFPSSYWKTTIDALSEQGYRVISPDQIGFGKSTKPQDYQYTLHQLAYNTKSLLEYLNVDEINLTGHSMGGMLATRFALMFPQLTKKLILLNPIGFEDWKTVVPYQTIDQSYKSELMSTEESIRNYQKQNYYNGEWKPPYDEWVEVLYRWTLNPNFKLLAYNNALTYDMIFSQPVVYEFKNLKMPTALIVGQLDKTALGKNLASKENADTLGNYPVLGKRIAALIPNSTLIEIENVGHLPHIEAFDKFIDPYLKFLDM